MKPIIRTYQNSDRNVCISSFKSNIPKYFANEELAYFEQFLNKIELKVDGLHYDVVILKNQLIGCGGFSVCENDTIVLAWD